MSAVGGAPGVKDLLSGHPGHLNPEQSHKLQKFKEELSTDSSYNAEEFDDAYLLRFLRARKFDMPKTMLMWNDFIKWRSEFGGGVDHLYNNFEYPEAKEVDKIYPQFYHKTDKDGRPVYIEILGKIDLTKLFQVTTSDRQLQRLVTEYEKFLRDRLPVCSEVKGELIETSCTIMDLKDVGISQFWKVKGQVQAAAGISSNNYPETMGKFYIINAPWAFTSVWSLVKGWLDPVTVAKITILGHNYQSTLHAQIPKENLPSFLGGTCHCTQGCTLSDAGPWQDPALVEKAKGRRTNGAGETYRVGTDAAQHNGGTQHSSSSSTSAAPAATFVPVASNLAAHAASEPVVALPVQMDSLSVKEKDTAVDDHVAPPAQTADSHEESTSAHDGPSSTSFHSTSAVNRGSPTRSVVTVPLPAETEMTTVVSKVDA